MELLIVKKVLGKAGAQRVSDYWERELDGWERHEVSAELPSSNYALGEKKREREKARGPSWQCPDKDTAKGMQVIWSLGIPVDLSHISDDQKACPESTHVNFNTFQGMKPCIIPKKISLHKRFLKILPHAFGEKQQCIKKFSYSAWRYNRQWQMDLDLHKMTQTLIFWIFFIKSTTKMDHPDTQFPTQPLPRSTAPSRGQAECPKVKS